MADAHSSSRKHGNSGSAPKLLWCTNVRTSVRRQHAVEAFLCSPSFHRLPVFWIDEVISYTHAPFSAARANHNLPRKPAARSFGEGMPFALRKGGNQMELDNDFSLKLMICFISDSFRSDRPQWLYWPIANSTRLLIRQASMIVKTMPTFCCLSGLCSIPRKQTRHIKQSTPGRSATVVARK